MIDTSFIKGSPDSDELCREIARESGGVCFLSFSRGKDALAAWLNLTRFFDRVIPFTCAAVPHVPFADEYLAYVERVFGTHVIRLQDGGLYSMIDALQFQYPHDEPWIEKAQLPIYDAQNMADALRTHLGLPRAWTAYGLNASDSIDRMITVRQCRGRYYGTRSFYPNYDWTHAQIMQVLKDSGIALSNEYHIASRSVAGAPLPHTLLAVERRAPDLLARLEHFYPLIRASLARAHWRNEKCLPKKPEKEKAAKAEGRRARGTRATRRSGGASGKTATKRSSAKATTRRSSSSSGATSQSAR